MSCSLEYYSFPRASSSVLQRPQNTNGNSPPDNITTVPVPPSLDLSRSRTANTSRTANFYNSLLSTHSGVAPDSSGEYGLQTAALKCDGSMYGFNFNRYNCKGLGSTVQKYQPPNPWQKSWRSSPMCLFRSGSSAVSMKYQLPIFNYSDLSWWLCAIDITHKVGAIHDISIAAELDYWNT